MSAWEQWGKKKPTNGLQGAQDALHHLLQATPLSTVSTRTIENQGQSLTFSLQTMWNSTRDLTKTMVTTSQNSTTSDPITSMENGHLHDKVDEATVVQWPLWRKHASPQNGLMPTMTWNTRFKYFVGMTMLGLLFFGMASLFLPLIMIRPSKFALSFTLGSISSMSAFAMLKGPAEYLSGLLQPNRLLLTSAYFVTLGCTLYSCLIMGNYIFVVLSSVLQLMTLGMFALSAFPGSTSGFKAFGMLFWKSARNMIQALVRLLR
ncbi:protein transport protein sft2-like [Plasmopara halstedii]|uniref:Vesicle transport protein n=1 Tax=Plasmopara halstedii TaxID=4781 RepID=A0A0P1B3Z8_PLAHL|nr:protein transport protein sft2-like [Plasmopara halstedii]CEG49015.1 protein transport protein sft2-like [Plasmopara halstedii]|eukprot:XP_024585384.1 protein transport protein sft2-like [Plasmopara halstedii]